MVVRILRATQLCLLLASLATQDRVPTRGPDAAWRTIQQRHDADHDGKVTRAEYGRDARGFSNLDRDGDGVLTRADFVAAGGTRRAPGAGGARAAARPAERSLPKAGDPAPDFELPLVYDPESTLRLSSHRGRKPVALIFGSYT